MKKQLSSILITATLGVTAVSAEIDCIAVSDAVRQQVTAEQSKVLEIVASKISESPSCACEIVKSAITASDAEKNDVAAIVEVAIVSSPDQMRLITQCAIAAAPSALPEIQAVLARFDPNSGDSVSNSKSAKSSKGDDGSNQASQPNDNPLNTPGVNPQGSPLDSFSADGTNGGTTGGVGGIGSLLGRNPAGSLSSNFFGGFLGVGGIFIGDGFGSGFIVNPPVVTSPAP